MKILLSTLIFVSLNVFATDSLLPQHIETVLNPPRMDEVFVPPGFDDLDETEITFLNHSKSSCYLKTFAMPPAVDQVNKVVRVSNFSMILDGDFCKLRDIATPTTLKVGELPAGDYKLEFETSNGQFKTYSQFTISKSKSKQKDDFEYAALDINELTVKVNRTDKKIELTLPGSFPNGCYRFKETKVISDRSETVIEVLPIVEQFTSICTQDIKFYSKTVVIPYKVSQSMKKLVHIRSADGVAINRVVTLE